MWDFVFSILGVLGKRKKSNKEVNWNVGPVARIHVPTYTAQSIANRYSLYGGLYTSAKFENTQ